MNRPAPKSQGTGRPEYRAIVVHGRGQAEEVLRFGVPVTLLSAVAAARLGGAAWWRGLVDAARAAHPATPCIDILDCADAAGLAMAALRLGQAHLILWPESPAFSAVRAAAGAMGSVVFAARPPALDLSERGAHRKISEYLCPKIASGLPDRDSATSLR